ncbi:hypothetical protein [Filifactor alocis]|uniref:hypothetical protein n=1 Tax=Filifactor alocis TaxID=143361 RepID=UPI003FA0FF31
MNHIMSKDITLGLDDDYRECYEEIRLKEGQEYEITIKAKFKNVDNLDLSFISNSSNIVVNIDDIINIE